MSQKQGQDNHTNYMDDVKVKISEKYKPPPKYNLAMTYSQRLLLNKQLQEQMPKYDFKLEQNVKERMKEWRTARSQIALDKKRKLEQIKHDRELRNDEHINEEENSPKMVNYTTGGVLIPTQVNTNNYTNILTPIPLSKQTNAFQPIDKSPINISDFESDTASPFDNMELKTINDIEELKLVLQNDDKNMQSVSFQTVNKQSYDNYSSQDPNLTYFGYNIPHTTQNYPTTSLYSSSTTKTTNGYNYYTPNILQPNVYSFNNSMSSKFESPINSNDNDDNKFNIKTVPDIMKALQTELNNVHLDNKRISKEKRLSCNENVTSQDNLPNPYENLPKSLQETCNVVRSMGFPIARVARACNAVGDDHKKIVEHLLVMSELLDLGFPEDKVSQALLQCNNDRDKALEILIS